MSSAEVTCPRCDPATRSHDAHEPSSGYVFWDDLTTDEQYEMRQNGIEPDSENEVPCPVCEQEGTVTEEKAQAWHDAQKPVDPAIRGLDWANVPDPDDIPPAKFRFDWVDDNNANVIAVPPVPNEPVRIGILAWDADSWCFTRIDSNGEEIVGADTIECDIAAEAELRKADEQARIEDTGAALKARLKAIETSRQLYRDDSRDLAELGARIVARKWWRLFWSPVEN